MTTLKQSHRVQLALVLAAEETHPSISQIQTDVADLFRLAKRLQRIAERECNGVERWDAQARQMLASWTEADQAKADKETERATKRAAEIAARYGATVTTGGDPRGYVLVLNLKSGRSNAMGGGYGVEG